MVYRKMGARSNAENLKSVVDSPIGSSLTESQPIAPHEHSARQARV
ncbi:hypothetical protein IQ235_05295 [Oscillatoriales cyanobacterium LEGE 11467]|uniref:Uncharacterized protein n=1 Tax=Zarconia navalis LEGE 11467 TaxID=1828826 RepID=A0A928Z6B7_9CYAN|nr:hypothetical protein [Zarconia navalis LEGE 11467]